MHYGFIVPDMVDARPDAIAALARDAEAAGWDAIFFWDGDWGVSPWVVLTAMAERTERIRLGAILHPLPWRQPWLFARDTATLDQLSQGRLIVSIGLGAVHDDDWARGRTRFGMTVDRKVRAQQLDEGLAIVSQLWSGRPVTFHGRHYQLDEFSITPTPARAQRIPIWAVAAWGRRTSVERLRHCDGVLLDESVAPADLAAIRAFVAAERALPGPFDVVMEGDTRGDSAEEARARVQRWSELGVTWWVESMWEPRGPVDAARRRIAQGPPAC
jgi:alkanesulfonate monooxygenase SsuD/methylene tetrahydromethanopterin reductase-like flavin-dependent oxidoreductase (luciferase family)